MLYASIVLGYRCLLLLVSNGELCKMKRVYYHHLITSMCISLYLIIYSSINSHVYILDKYWVYNRSHIYKICITEKMWDNYISDVFIYVYILINTAFIHITILRRTQLNRYDAYCRGRPPCLYAVCNWAGLWYTCVWVTWLILWLVASKSWLVVSKWPQ